MIIEHIGENPSNPVRDGDGPYRPAAQLQLFYVLGVYSYADTVFSPALRDNDSPRRRADRRRRTQLTSTDSLVRRLRET